MIEKYQIQPLLLMQQIYSIQITWFTQKLKKSYKLMYPGRIKSVFFFLIKAKNQLILLKDVDHS